MTMIKQWFADKSIFTKLVLATMTSVAGVNLLWIAFGSVSLTRYRRVIDKGFLLGNILFEQGECRREEKDFLLHGRTDPVFYETKTIPILEKRQKDKESILNHLEALATLE